MNPTIITLASTLAGLTGLEIIKYLQDKKLDNFKNTDINLATPSLVFS